MGQQHKGRTRGRSDCRKYHVFGLRAQTECKEGVPTAENAVSAGTFLANICLEIIAVALLLLLLLYLAWKYGHTVDDIPTSVNFYYKTVPIWDYLLF